MGNKINQKRVLHGIRYFLCGLILLGWGQPPEAQPRFEDYFVETDRIELPVNHLISSINSLDVLGNQVLITEFGGNGIYRYRLGSDSLHKLNPEECFPGFTLLPVDLIHLPDSSILLTNAAQSGYRFHYDGSCLDSIDNRFRPAARNFTVVGNTYAFHTLQREGLSGSYYLISYDHQAERKQRFELTEVPFPNYNNRQLAGGMFVSGDNIYISFSSGADIFIYDLESGSLKTVIPADLSYADSITEDIPPRADDIVRRAIKASEGKYTLQSMYQLTKGIAIQQINLPDKANRKYALELTDVNSSQRMGDPLYINEWIYFAGDGYIYTVQQKEDTEEELYNPEIVVYQYIGPDSF